MEFVPTHIPGAFEVRHDVFSDERGRFRRQYCEREFAATGLTTHWVQVNQSVTLGAGSIRGMHFQNPPAAEAKFVGCTLGQAYDVAVDLRRGSPTFL
jgi:dTDP-4-dehydrorhamnose 3,5-epimerase